MASAARKAEVVSVAGWTLQQRRNLLYVLWQHRQPLVIYSVPGSVAPEWNEAEALAMMKDPTIEYLCGRSIKIDMRGDEWDLTTYNSEVLFQAPTGTLLYERVVLKMKAAAVGSTRY